MLVSDAVKTLQKEWTTGLGGSATHLSGLVGSLCYGLLQKIINIGRLKKRPPFALNLEDFYFLKEGTLTSISGRSVI